MSRVVWTADPVAEADVLPDRFYLVGLEPAYVMLLCPVCETHSFQVDLLGGGWKLTLHNGVPSVSPSIDSLVCDAHFFIENGDLRLA